MKSRDQNKNSRIVNRVDRTGKLRTETRGRDEETLTFAVSTSPRSNSTAFYIDIDGRRVLNFSGSEARSIYRVLQKHYAYTGQSL